MIALASAFPDSFPERVREIFSASGLLGQEIPVQHPAVAEGLASGELGVDAARYEALRSAGAVVEESATAGEDE